jgi:hypothetical protein
MTRMWHVKQLLRDLDYALGCALARFGLGGTATAVERKQSTPGTGGAWAARAVSGLKYACRG